MSGNFGLASGKSGKCQGFLFCQVCMNPDLHLHACMSENLHQTSTSIHICYRYIQPSVLSVALAPD